MRIIGGYQNTNKVNKMEQKTYCPVCLSGNYTPTSSAVVCEDCN